MPIANMLHQYIITEPLQELIDLKMHGVGATYLRNLKHSGMRNLSAQQIARLRALAHDAKLDPDFAEKFLGFIVKEVIHHHEAMRAERQ